MMLTETAQQEADRLLTDDRARRLIVNHTAPHHDAYCRCRDCKPALIGQTSDDLFRFRVAIVGLAVVTMGMVLPR